MQDEVALRHHLSADVLRQDFVDQCLVADAPAPRLLQKLLEYAGIQANRNELPGPVAQRRTADPPHGLQLFWRRIGSLPEAQSFFPAIGAFPAFPAPRTDGDGWFPGISISPQSVSHCQHASVGGWSQPQKPGPHARMLQVWAVKTDREFEEPDRRGFDVSIRKARSVRHQATRGCLGYREAGDGGAAGFPTRGRASGFPEE